MPFRFGFKEIHDQLICSQVGKHVLFRQPMRIRRGVVDAVIVDRLVYASPFGKKQQPRCQRKVFGIVYPLHRKDVMFEDKRPPVKASPDIVGDGLLTEHLTQIFPVRQRHGMHRADYLAAVHVGKSSVHNVGPTLLHLLYKHLHRTGGQSVVAIHVHEVLSCGCIEGRCPRRPKSAVVLVAYDAHLILPLGIVRQHFPHHLDASVGRAIVHEDVLYVAIRLAEQGLRAGGDICFNPINGHKNGNCLVHHVNE